MPDPFPDTCPECGSDDPERIEEVEPGVMCGSLWHPSNAGAPFVSPDTPSVALTGVEVAAVVDMVSGLNQLLPEPGAPLYPVKFGRIPVLRRSDEGLLGYVVLDRGAMTFRFTPEAPDA